MSKYVFYIVLLFVSLSYNLSKHIFFFYNIYSCIVYTIFLFTKENCKIQLQKSILLLFTQYKCPMHAMTSIT